MTSSAAKAMSKFTKSPPGSIWCGYIRDGTSRHTPRAGKREVL